MTDYYLRSTDGSDADDGSTWALAKATIANIATLDAAGDRILVSQAHAESTAANISIALAGTTTSPTQVICCNDGAEPPTTLATSATITSSASNGAITFAGSAYVYGITFIAGAGTNNNPVIQCGGSSGLWQRFENCKFQLATGGASSGVIRGLPSNAAGLVEWINCEVKFAAVGQSITSVDGFLHWNGGGITAGGTSPTNLISSLSAGAAVGGARLVIENCDFSAGSSTMNMLNVQTPYAYVVVFRNCKMPSSWTGSWSIAYSTNAQGRLEVYNCSDGFTNTALKILDGSGTIDVETTFIKSAGASDGATGISWKMVSDSDVAYPAAALVSSEMALWNTQTGVSKTFSVSILRDSATNLKNNEVWLELTYPGSSSNPMNALVTSKCAVLATAVDCAADSAGWTTTGMANPNKQKISVTFTPQAVGTVTARVFLAKPSTTIYVDPAGVLS